MTATIDRLRAALAGRYEISREIGQGGMATVFLGHDLKHDRDVAIKVLHPDLGAALGSERFLSEIKTTAKLQHPHILPLLDSGEADSLLYYVMPFVVGESLRARIDRERQLPINEAVRIAKEVAGALDYAHRQGVIHRDIKPENILLHDKQALVADFGIALAVSAAGGGRLTQTGLSLGTPQYMSPEQAVGERTIDARSDIYSLGAVTYEMITGDPPFAGSTVQAIVSKIMTERPTPMSRLRETVPETVEDAVTIALSKLPADRFASADEFANALTTHISGFTRETEVPRSGAGRRRADFFRQRGVIALTALSAILLVAALWGWLRPTPPKQVMRVIVGLDSSEALAGTGGGRVALSPDGGAIVYAGGDQNDLFLRPFSELHSQRLPGTTGALAPIFSPDAKQIAFTTYSYQLKVLSVAGGPPLTINEIEVGRAGGSWGNDGYLYTSTRAGDGIVRLRPVPRAPLEKLSFLDSTQGEVGHRLPEILPSTKAMVFIVYYNGNGRTGTAIAVQRLGEKTHTVLLDGSQAKYLPSGYLFYVAPNATLTAIRFDERSLKISGDPIVVSGGLRTGPIGAGDLAVSRTGTLAFTLGESAEKSEALWVSREGKAQPVDPTWQGVFGYPAISHDGTRLALNVGAQPTNIWIKRLDRGPALKLTFDGNNNPYASWTPDDKSVTYYSNAVVSGSNNTLWTKRADGSAQAVLQLKRKELDLADALWSPDGKWLVFRTGFRTAGLGDIYALRPGVDTAPIPLVVSKFSELCPDLSPDGRFMVYSSDESGRNEIYVVPFPNSSAARWAVSTSGGTEPRWSHHGDEIFYRDASGNMVSVPVKTAPSFSFGERRILFPAATYQSYAPRREYDISPDDRRFLMLRNIGSHGSDKLVIVTNWLEELKGKH